MWRGMVYVLLVYLAVGLVVMSLILAVEVWK